MTKTVLITDSSPGIGLEFAKIFAREKYKLVLIFRSAVDVKKIQKDLEKELSSKIIFIARDLSDPKSVEQIFNELKKKKIKIDVLINNASLATHGEFTKIPLKKNYEEINVNIYSFTALAKLAASEMVERKRGMILNVSSTAAFRPGPQMSVYYATEAYVLSFSQALSHELGKSGVTVTVLCPGYVHKDVERKQTIWRASIFRSATKPAEVARIGYDSLMSGERVVVPGFINRLGVLLVRILPQSFVM